jgi:hypothetical protein
MGAVIDGTSDGDPETRCILVSRWWTDLITVIDMARSVLYFS